MEKFVEINDILINPNNIIAIAPYAENNSCWGDDNVTFYVENGVNIYLAGLDKPIKVSGKTIEEVKIILNENKGVAPIIHAKWIEHPHEWGENWENSKYECTACHNWSEFDYDYCPNCGAKMDEEDLK